MQADSEKLKQAWIRAMQNSIATAFRDRSDDSEVTLLRINPICTIIKVLIKEVDLFEDRVRKKSVFVLVV